MKMFAFLLCLFFLAFASCKQEDKKEETKVEVSEDEIAPEDEKWDIPQEVDNRPLNVKIDSLKESIEKAYLEMSENDNQKFAALRSMLDNTKLVKGFKFVEEAAKIKKAADEVEKLRFTRESITDGAKMSVYDKKTEELIAMIKALYDLSNQFEGNTSASKAAAEVISRDQDDFFFRKNFSSLVREYNELLAAKKSEIEKLDEKYRNLKPESDFKYAD